MIRIGTRASRLALIQAGIVASKLNSEFEIVPIITSGDKNKTTPLYDIGGKELFIKELEEALLAGEIDIAVHSLKDIPGLIDDRFEIAAVLERENPSDVLISRDGSNINTLSIGAVIGTSSPRRMVYIKNLRPDLMVVNIRGNVETRIKKVMDGDVDATILAGAGLIRLGLFDSKNSSILEADSFIPAVGQGVIAIEALKQNAHLYKALNHEYTYDMISIEREFLRNLYADCRTPAGCYARTQDGELLVDYMFAEDVNYQVQTYRYVCPVYDINKAIAHSGFVAKTIKSRASKDDIPDL